MTFSVKHFNADLTGWEEKNSVERFPLIKVTAREVYFDEMTYRRTGPDSMDVYVFIHKRAGGTAEERFQYKRIKES